jgi:hypothetical protein
MLLQFPILIALYQTFQLAVGETPEAIVKLSDRLYDLPILRSAIPLEADFLGLHLGQPNQLVIPILVASTTFALQKMSMLPPADERQRAQNSMMNLMMPLIFGYITITLPSGLGLYYVLSNIIGIVMQYAFVGGGPFNWRALIGLSDEPVLPRAVEQRQRQQEDTQRRLAELDAARAAEEPEPQEESPVARRRRRRYESGGRRRGRR